MLNKMSLIGRGQMSSHLPAVVCKTLNIYEGGMDAKVGQHTRHQTPSTEHLTVNAGRHGRSRS